MVSVLLQPEAAAAARLPAEISYRDCYVSFQDSGSLLIYDEIVNEKAGGITSTLLRDAWAPGTWARAWRVDEPPKEG